MCEPHHSITQWPDEDDRGPTSGRLENLPTQPQQGGGFWDRIRRIMRWFHLSRMGAGHSESHGVLYEGMGRHLLPPETRYEAKWWNRSVVLDGPYVGNPGDAKEALECAHEYANRVSIGNLTLLRQFLERSMRISSMPFMYIAHFADGMLIPSARDGFYKKMKLALGITKGENSIAFYRKINQCREQAIKLVLGFTRRREILVPEWRDDNGLWVTG